VKEKKFCERASVRFKREVVTKHQDRDPPVGVKKIPPLHRSRHKQEYSIHTTTNYRQVSILESATILSLDILNNPLTSPSSECILWYVTAARDLQTNPRFDREHQTPSSDTIADSLEKYTLGADGKRVYTLKKVVDGKVSKSA
jgi:hypothetical protein